MRTIPFLLALLCAAPAWAQAKKSVSDYFPTEVGRSWTYKLLLEAGGKKKEIEYTTKVARQEELSGVGPCTVLVSTSADRPLKDTWFALKDGKLVHQREKGYRAKSHTTQDFTGRTLLTDLELKGFKGDGSDSRLAREWTSSDGSQGKVQLVKTERVYLQGVGDLKGCLVIVDRARYYKGKGEAKKVVRKSKLTVWLAPGLGKVKEELELTKPDGTRVFHTVATLKKFQEP